MNIKPFNGRLAIERIELEQKSDSLLIIPEPENKPTAYGKVIAISEGKLTNSGTMIPHQAKPGDIVCVSKYVGTEIGNNYIIIHEDDVLAIIEGN